MKNIHTDESGSAVLMIIVLITVLAIIICQNGVVLRILKKELQLVEEKHEQRIRTIQKKND